MQVVLFDDMEIRNNLKPLSLTRPIADMRCGIFTFRERWEYFWKEKTYSLTETYLQELYPMCESAENIFINAAIFANGPICENIRKLNFNSKLVSKGILIAYNGIESNLMNMQIIEYTDTVMQIKNLWDIFSMNDVALRNDFNLLVKGKTSATVSASNTIIGDAKNIFLEQGATVEASVLNCETGPIYIATGAEIMENCAIRGPFAMREGAQLKMSSKIYGATTLGPNCKVGGEVNNAVFFANSSKAHDGFIGNSVIGEWCNIGADSNNSNLKNNYEEVKLWSEQQNTFVKTGLQFCGLILADHSKCGINTMFNTGTVVGVSCNIFGSGFPRNYIPSFSWGGAAGITTYKIEKVLETMRLVFARRNKILSQADEKLYRHLASALNNN
jgi:UDP-N-acetylglucosamine diphosphorylase/glucosamine-1-phosphate N-acetyltransferase